MLKEIQKDILKELNDVFNTIENENAVKLTQYIMNAKKIILVGVGREGLATRAFAMRLMHLGFNVHWIWDDTTPSLSENDLLIATSGSGEIGHIHYIIEKAKTIGSKIAIITGDITRKSVKLADLVIFIPATVYLGSMNLVKSKQIMGNLFEQSLLILFDSIILEMINQNNFNIDEIIERHRNLE
ncbi:TPA: SIS domain-containing protein [Candidatus Poribacteria bacterium]|jgi:6-phospho-3-hexuloisomerase|nr:SIS domain-containing protein [Candidatus Poribacteria bacterium]